MSNRVTCFKHCSNLGWEIHFINWVKFLYTNPLAADITNGLRSDRVRVNRGTGQVVMVANRQHKFTLYADDVLIFLTRTLIDVVIEFSFFFSGYEINFGKSDAMPLGSLEGARTSLMPFPFKWSPSCLAYLGIRISPMFNRMSG